METGDLPPEEPEEPEEERPKSILQRANGREVERMCIYLPPELAEDLRVHCARKRRQISEVIAAAIKAHLR